MALVPYYTPEELGTYYDLLPNEVAVAYGQTRYSLPVIEREDAPVCSEVRAIQGIINSALYVEKDPASFEWAKDNGFGVDLIRENRVGTSNIQPNKNRIQTYKVSGIWNWREGGVLPDLIVLPIKRRTDVIATAVLYRIGSWSIRSPGAWIFNLDAAEWQPTIEVETDLTTAIKRISLGEMNVVSTAGPVSSFQRLVLSKLSHKLEVVYPNGRVSVRV